jgi:mannose-6-phosphate isomerase-like protein (cupin superfamily)
MVDKVDKPLGCYIDIFRSSGRVLKLIHVDSKKRLSLQSHSLRDEIWYLFCELEGGILELDGKLIPLKFGEEHFIKRGQKHRLINTSDSSLAIIEMQLGQCLEDDIERYEDDFGRAD